METLYRVEVLRGSRAEYVTAASFDGEGRPAAVRMANCLGGGHGYTRQKAEALRGHLAGPGVRVTIDSV